MPFYPISKYRLTMQKNNKTCLVCNGTGREKHKFIRSDGEYAEETIICELCNGIGCINIREESTFKENNFSFDDTNNIFL